MANFRKLIIFLGFLAVFTSTANAEVYTYTGQPYQDVVPPYSAAMMVTGWFETAEPLPADMVLRDLGPLGDDLVLRWAFSDGVRIYNESNSIIVPYPFGGFTVDTNSTGQINQAFIMLLIPESGALEMGQTLTTLYISHGRLAGPLPAHGYEAIVSPRVCLEVADGTCIRMLPVETLARFVVAFLDSDPTHPPIPSWSRSFTAAASPVPVLPGYWLALTMLGLMLFAGAKIRRMS